MTPEEQISNMKKAMTQAIKVMGDRFGSTDQDVVKAIEGLKVAMLATSQPSTPGETVSRSAGQLPRNVESPVGT